MRMVLVVSLTSVLLWRLAFATDKGLVAAYDFEAGTGTVARDVSGHGYDGKLIGGASWEKGEFGTALRLNGADAYVDCGSALSPRLEKQGTLLLWVKPEVLQGGLINWSTGQKWPDERLVWCFDTYHGAARMMWAIADGRGSVSNYLPNPPAQTWTQLALAYDGSVVRPFTNGIADRETTQRLTPALEKVALWLGRCQGLGGTPSQDYFAGLIDEVRIYDRPLTAAEVLALYKAEAGRRGHDTRAFRQPTVVAAAEPLSGRLNVTLRYGLMQPLPGPAQAVLRVGAAPGGKPVAERRLPLPNDRGEVRVSLDLGDLQPGLVRLTARVLAKEKPYGEAATVNVNWPRRDPRFSPERGVKILNNFCFELLNTAKPGEKTFTVHNPREGWLFFQVQPQTAPLGSVVPAVELDGKTVPLRQVKSRWEAMRYVAAGPHRVQVTVGRGAWVQTLIVRAVGELVYAMYGANPPVPETGRYTWEWLRRHCLDHYNTVIGPTRADWGRAEIKEWTDQGGQWMTQRNLPFNMTVEQVVDYWTSEPGFADPLMSGIWADEFYGGDSMKAMYPVWCEALRRIKADPKYAGKRFYAFTSSTYIADYELLTKTLMECGYRIGAEWYLKEAPTEAGLEGVLGPEWEARNRKEWDAAAPEASMSRVWVLGLLSQPEESCDIYPQCDYNVFLDRQFEFLANDPAFFGLRGLYGYYSPYVGEEQTRVFAKLVRHYALEGHTDRMLQTPYELKHLKNPDFTAGLADWQVTAAEAGSVAPRRVPGFGFLQGRYINAVGDTAAWTKRSAERPNVLAQEVRGLQPGRLYSLRFFTGNYQDYLAGKSNPYRHAVRAELMGVQLVPEKCFQVQIKSNYGHIYGPFNRDNPYRMNYHQQVFRALAPTAKLTLSDWQSATEPGGPAGEELIWNFVQLQPYIPED